MVCVGQVVLASSDCHKKLSHIALEAIVLPLIARVAIKAVASGAAGGGFACSGHFDECSQWRLLGRPWLRQLTRLRVLHLRHHWKAQRSDGELLSLSTACADSGSRVISVSPGRKQRTCTGPRILHSTRVCCFACLILAILSDMMLAAMGCCRPFHSSRARFTGFIGFSRSGPSGKEKVLSPRRPSVSMLYLTVPYHVSLPAASDTEVAYTFGLSEWEIFWPLVAGATLVIAPPGTCQVQRSAESEIWGAVLQFSGGEKDADYLLRRACNAFTPPCPKELLNPPQGHVGRRFRNDAAAHVLEEDARLLPGRGPSPDLIHCVAAHVFVPLLVAVFSAVFRLRARRFELATGAFYASDGPREVR